MRRHSFGTNFITLLTLQTNMIKAYRCSHCNQRIVVLETRTGSYLPVEIEDGKITIADEEFDGSKHNSHLKNCPPLALEWEIKKKKFIQRNNVFAGLDLKALSK